MPDHAPHRRLAPLAVALLALALSACGDDEPDAEAAEAAACDSVGEVAAAVDSFEGTVQADATIAEIREARDGLEEAQAALDDAVDDVAQERVDAFEDAWQELDAAVADVDDDLTVPEAVASLEEELRAVVTARDGLVGAIDCSTA